MTPTSPPKTEAAGFTLMEMLVVLTIMAIVAAIAIIRLPAASSAGKRERLAVLARQTIEGARARAMAEGRDVMIGAPDLAPGANQLSIAGSGRATKLIFFPDGTTSGGEILLASHPLLDVDWLSGSVSDAG